MTPTGILSLVALLTNNCDGKGQKGSGSQGKKPLGQCYLGCAVHYQAIFASYKYNGKGQKGLGLQGQKPLGQCYLGSAVHYWAILAVTPTGILSVVALLTSTYDGKGQKGTSSQGQKPLGQC